MTLKTLCLLRHAHSMKGDAITPDHERELSSGGVEECASISNWMKNNDFSVDCVLCSDAMRTRQTYGAISAISPLPTAEYDLGLYLASSNGILKAIKKAPKEARSLLVIGHNPGLHDIALRLLQDEERSVTMLISGLVTAGLIILEVPDKSWNELAFATAHLKHYIKP